MQGEDDREDISASDNSLPTKKQMFPARETLPVAAWEATACASGVGLVSCVCPGSGERCSTHRKSTHPCSPRPSEALRRKREKKPQSENHDTLSDLTDESQPTEDVI